MPEPDEDDEDDDDDIVDVYMTDDEPDSPPSPNSGSGGMDGSVKAVKVRIRSLRWAWWVTFDPLACTIHYPTPPPFSEKASLALRQEWQCGGHVEGRGGGDEVSDVALGS